MEPGYRNECEVETNFDNFLTVREMENRKLK